MAQLKPLGSLTSGLLARKGHARPAMRPQGFAGFGSPTANLDDLGWNDMGEGGAPEPAPVTPIVAPGDAHPAEPVAEKPPVLVEREALKQEVETPPVDAPAPKPIRTSASPLSSAATRKAAFTLRLDADRHLRLRLASATRHQSAQQLVTAALDQFLAGLPELDDLVRQLPTTTPNGSTKA